MRREVQRLTDDRDSWRDQASARTADAVKYARERDALRAEVERLRSGEPVATKRVSLHSDLGDREPLTPEQIDAVWAGASDPDQPEMSIHDFARAIERELGITPDKESSNADA